MLRPNYPARLLPASRDAFVRECYSRLFIKTYFVHRESNGSVVAYCSVPPERNVDGACEAMSFALRGLLEPPFDLPDARWGFQTVDYTYTSGEQAFEETVGELALMKHLHLGTSCTDGDLPREPRRQRDERDE